MKRILITGANSFVGTSVEQWLLKHQGMYEVDTVDCKDGQWKKARLADYDVIFHVAGIAHVDPKPDMAPLYYQVNRDLTIEIARAAKEAGVKQFIFMSSMIVYHASKSLKGTVIDSSTLPAPNDFYGDSKLQAEKGIETLASDDFKVAILRPCMIYGNGGRGNFQRLARLALRTPVFPAWHNKRSMLYIDNLSEFVRQTIDRSLNGIFHLQNREYADTVAIVRHYAKAAGHSIWISRLFCPAVWLGAFFLTPLCKMFANQYYTSDLTTYDFDYQLISFDDSLKMIKL
ncbi:MAG: sugar nucleotide-binding protein [Pseudoflavonifractor sp.]|nr:sugar nucleotide-binding protein [Alloprevotella sp.]MCM1116073.1 sugar nucleotide-binding protein [Pseudoflavonifractor sp.]